MKHIYHVTITCSDQYETETSSDAIERTIANINQNDIVVSRYNTLEEKWEPL